MMLHGHEKIFKEYQFSLNIFSIVQVLACEEVASSCRALL